jgi:hypothetical protein
MSATTGTSRGIRTTIILGIVATLLFIGGIFVAYRLLVQAPAELARVTAEGVKSIFNITPRVTINETIVIEQSTPILEVATISRHLLVDHAWSHSWLGSTKSIHLRGTFTAKAGFDLREPFTIDITRSPLTVTARLPEPRLLSVQMDSFVVIADEDGWWNRLTEEDRTEAVTTLQSLGRTRAETSGILDDVRRSAEERIREVVERNGAAVIFEQTRKPS